MDETSVLELVELSSGEVALKRADSEDKPLVKIEFSEESEMAMDSHSLKMAVARAMIEAGIEAYADLQISTDMDSSNDQSHRIH